MSESTGMPKFRWLQFYHADKLIHAVLFFGEAVLIAAAVQSKISIHQYFGIFLWCVFLGGAMEVIQAFWVPSRSGDVLDLLADAIGALIGLVLISTIIKK